MAPSLILKIHRTAEEIGSRCIELEYRWPISFSTRAARLVMTRTQPFRAFSTWRSTLRALLGGEEREHFFSWKPSNRERLILVDPHKPELKSRELGKRPGRRRLWAQ